jgi:hypothetical protein
MYFTFLFPWILKAVHVRVHEHEHDNDNGHDNDNDNAGKNSSCMRVELRASGSAI